MAVGAITAAGVFSQAGAQIAQALRTGAKTGAGQTKEHVNPRVVIGGQMRPESHFTVLSWTRSLGGAKVDQAVVAVELGGHDQPLYIQDSSPRSATIEKPLEIWHNGKRMFWGVIEDTSWSMGESADTVQLIASIQPWHFGPPIAQVQYLSAERTPQSRDNINFTVVRADEPIVFNGFVRGDREHTELTSAVFVGNKAHLARFKAKKRDGTETTDETHMPVPLEMVQTDNGREMYLDVYRAYDDRTRWDLRSAARYLITLGNEERFISNPDENEYNVLPEFILPRTEIAVGRYLTEMLDELLTPYGFTWYVDPTPKTADNPSRTDGASIFGALAAQAQDLITNAASSTGKPRIRFAKRGYGPAVPAKYAKVGAKLDFGIQNLADVNQNYSISSTINEVHCIGAQIEIEGTWELYRVTEDKWVMNEGGEYNTTPYPVYHMPDTDEEDLQPQEVPIPKLTELFLDADFDGMHAAFISRVRRPRRFFPTITQAGAPDDGGTVSETRPIGPNNGYDIEVLNLPLEDEEASDPARFVNADRVPDAMFRHIRILEDECGIIFDRGKKKDADSDDNLESNDAAENVWFNALGQDARMRITATIRADVCIQVIVRRSGNPTSVANTKHTYVWPDPERWSLRRIRLTGRYASKYANDLYTTKTPTPKEVIADMERTARRVLERTDAARLSGAIVFNNFDEPVVLGGIVTEITGRNVSLNSRMPKDSSPLYPQIVSLHYDAQAVVIVATTDYEPASALEAFQ